MIWTVLADLKRPSMFCQNPHDGRELTATAELPGMGFPAASGARIQQLVHPHIEDELHQLWHLRLIGAEQLNGKISSVGDETSFIMLQTPLAVCILLVTQDPGKLLSAGFRAGTGVGLVAP